MKIHSNAVGGRNTVKAHADVDIFRVGDVPDDWQVSMCVPAELIA